MAPVEYSCSRVLGEFPGYIEWARSEQIAAKQVILWIGAVSLDEIFFFQAEDGIRGVAVTGVQTCALPISLLWRIHPSCRPKKFFARIWALPVLTLSRPCGGAVRHGPSSGTGVIYGALDF